MFLLATLLLICTVCAIYAVLNDELQSSRTNTGACKPSKLKLHRNLAHRSSMLKTMETLYNRYGAELQVVHKKMKTWCEKTRSCKYCDVEAEMLYMLIREWRPSRVFEMAPNMGYSSHIMLSALAANDLGTLHSFDIHSSAVQHMDPLLGRRWNFTEADVRQIAPDERTGTKFMSQFDFIFIDALHTEEFSSWYTRALLNSPVQCDTPVIVHDIVADSKGGGRESLPVYQYMSFALNVQFPFTVNPYHAPSPNVWIRDPLAIDNLRENTVGKNAHKYFECHGPSSDPSIFFLKVSVEAMRKPTSS